MNLIAFDPPIALLTRLIHRLLPLTATNASETNTTTALFLGFKALASEHMRHVLLIATSQVSEFLAITLLHHASVSVETLKNANIHVLALADARKK